MGKTVPSASSPTGVVTADSLASPCQRQPGDSASSEYGGTYGGLVPGSGKNVYGSILHPTDLGSNGSTGGPAGVV